MLRNVADRGLVRRLARAYGEVRRAQEGTTRPEIESRAELYKKLMESRDREIRALKLAVEARKSESEVRLELDKSRSCSGSLVAVVDKEEVEALRSELRLQQEENAKLQSMNRKLQEELSVLRRAQDHEMKLPEPCSVSELDFKHPWPEWTAFMEYLRKNSYFEAKALPEESLGACKEGRILGAALNFSKDRADIIRALSQETLMAFGAFGCPSTDRKVVDSGKKLRAHLNLTESQVCQFCSLSNTCSRANAENTLASTSAETSDLVRLLFQFAVDAVLQPTERRPLPEYVVGYIRNLLNQIVYFGENPEGQMKQEFNILELAPGDWKCLKCRAVNLSTFKRCRECNTACGQDLTRPGEWKCIKCELQNLGENSLCDQCNAPRPPKELRWGDWECPRCEHINFARNKLCHRCSRKQPPFRERKMIGFNPNASQDSTPKPTATLTTLGVTPWLLSREEKEAVAAASTFNRQ